MTSSNYKLDLNSRDNRGFSRDKDNLTYMRYRSGSIGPWRDVRSDVNDHVHSQRDHYLHFFQITADDSWTIETTGLKPNTRYKVYLGNKDYTQYCKPDEGKFGDNLISKEDGTLVFELFFGADYVNVRSDWADMMKNTRNHNFREQLHIVPDDGTAVDFSGNTAVSQPGIGSLMITDDTSTIIQPVECDYVQTFFIDPNSVNGANRICLTDIDLFFKTKPNRTNNKSGITDPKVLVELVDVDNNGKPIVSKSYRGSLVVKDFNEIATSTDSTIATNFAFSELVEVATNRFYGIAITFDDEDYELWFARAGDRSVGTNLPSPGSTVTHDGHFFQRTNQHEVVIQNTSSSHFRELTNMDLKFCVNVAKFTSNTITVDLVNKEHEFLSVDTITDDFYGGEWVYQNTSFETGTISLNSNSRIVTGTSTLFDSSDLVANDYIVITDGTAGNTAVAQVQSINSNTEMVLWKKPPFTDATANYSLAPIARVYQYKYVDNEIVLIDSNAFSNNTFTRVFSANGLLKGIDSGASANITSVDDRSVNEFLSDLSYRTPSLCTTSITYNFSHTDGNSYFVTANNAKQMDLLLPNHVTGYDARVMSRSQEVQDNLNLQNQNKSASIRVTFNYRGPNTNLFETPTLRADYSQLIGGKWLINNDSSGEELNGNAKARHITTKLTFADGRNAEDIRVFMNAYRPPNTDIKVYARIFNNEDPEAFDDKYWTELTCINNENVYSALENRKSIVEYTFGFPEYPPSSATLDGVITTELSNTTIVGSETTWDSDLANNQIIKIYSPLFPNNYTISVIDTVVSNTQLTLTQEISNNNVVGDGFKIDTLSTPYTAFSNRENDNIVRYHNSTSAIFDTYSTLAIKIVHLSTDEHVVPFVDDIRVVGVSV